MARNLAQIDRELRDHVNRRRSNTQDISRISGLVVEETAEIDRLLAERSALTTPKVPDTPEGAELPPRTLTS
jgi:hypothetical protein